MDIRRPELRAPRKGSLAGGKESLAGGKRSLAGGKRSLAGARRWGRPPLPGRAGRAGPADRSGVSRAGRRGSGRPPRPAGRWPRARRSSPATPSVPYGRTVSPASSHAAANAAVSSPSPNQTKFACCSGMSQPCSRSAATTRSRSATSSLTRTSSSSVASSEASAATCASELTPNGRADLRSAVGDRLVRHGVADPQPGEPVGLGEGAQHDDVRVGLVDGQRVRGVGRVDELEVGLVDDDEHVARHAGEEGLELGRADRRAGRVVRRADEDQPGALGDGVRHRVEVVPVTGRERHHHRPGARRAS